MGPVNTKAALIKGLANIFPTVLAALATAYTPFFNTEKPFYAISTLSFTQFTHFSFTAFMFSNPINFAALSKKFFPFSFKSSKCLSTFNYSFRNPIGFFYKVSSF
jgi:hypothetical protein